MHATVMKDGLGHVIINETDRLVSVTVILFIFIVTPVQHNTKEINREGQTNWDLI